MFRGFPREETRKLMVSCESSMYLPANSLQALNIHPSLILVYTLKYNIVIFSMAGKLYYKKSAVLNSMPIYVIR